MINEQFDLNNNSLLFINNHNNHNDISYTRYVTEDTNLQALCSPDLHNIDKSFTVHDYECEFLLLKYITETNQHKAQMLKEGEMVFTLNHKPLNLPYQYNALSINNSHDVSNYINASYITAPCSHMFIATENPLT
jgi:protein tyrosine phosphatase